mgnify:CR=1 FL=1
MYVLRSVSSPSMMNFTRTLQHGALAVTLLQGHKFPLIVFSGLTGMSNMNKFAIGATLAAVSLLVSGHAIAQTDAEALREHNKVQFADWSGIAFQCLIDAEDDDFQKLLCETARTDAKFLAATAKIPFRDLGNDDHFQVSLAKRELNGDLLLEARIKSTAGAPRAVHMGLRALSHYSDAVEVGATGDDPQSKPRSGELILWQKNLIGTSGSDENLGQALSNAFSNVLKDFFGTFVESRN